MRYVMRHGRRIAVETLDTGIVPKKRRKPFKVEWVKLPLRWVETLRRSKSASTKQLALEILFAAFKREQCGGEIVLSLAMTRIPRNTRVRAARELAKLGLIKIEQKGNEAMRVSYIYYYKE
jgi:hypothetical protein